MGTSVCLNQNTNSSTTPTIPGINLNFAFVNYLQPEDAKNALTNGKTNDLILNLLDSEWEKNNKQDFLFYAQNKSNRMSYLKAKRKKKNSIASFSNMMNFYMKSLKSADPRQQKLFYKMLSDSGLGNGLPGMAGGKN